jgi:hypothetical protein
MGAGKVMFQIILNLARTDSFGNGAVDMRLERAVRRREVQLKRLRSGAPDCFR